MKWLLALGALAVVLRAARDALDILGTAHEELVE
jgi:hypothetical protein